MAVNQEVYELTDSVREWLQKVKKYYDKRGEEFDLDGAISNYSTRYPQLLEELRAEHPESIRHVSDTPGDPNDLYELASRTFVEEFTAKKNPAK